MPRYRVRLEGVVDTIVVVDAQDEQTAIDNALAEVDTDGEIDWLTTEAEEIEEDD